MSTLLNVIKTHSRSGLRIENVRKEINISYKKKEEILHFFKKVGKYFIKYVCSKDNASGILSLECLRMATISHVKSSKISDAAK